MMYFDHSTDAGSDDKIIALRLECGGAAVDAYWCAVEQIYRDETALDVFGNRHVKRALCHRLNVNEETLENWFSSMVEIGLLEIDVENTSAVISKRAKENIASYHEKCETARQNGKKGGRKPTRKPKANRPGNRRQTDGETGGQANKTKQNKGFGLVYPNQKPSASGDAAAADAAPPSAKPYEKPYCPLCGAEMPRQDGTAMWWECRTCGAIKAEAVVWR